MIELLVILDAPQILCNARPYFVWQLFFVLTFASFTIFLCFFYPLFISIVQRISMIIKLKSMKQSFNILISTRFYFVCLYCLSAKMYVLHKDDE